MSGNCRKAKAQREKKKFQVRKDRRQGQQELRARGHELEEATA
jgi:hypothetical protein